jgi:hypothetical protein
MLLTTRLRIQNVLRSAGKNVTRVVTTIRNVVMTVRRSAAQIKSMSALKSVKMDVKLTVMKHMFVQKSARMDVKHMETKQKVMKHMFAQMSVKMDAQL